MVCHVLQLRSRFAQLASTKQEVQRESMEWYEAVAGQLKAEAEKRLKLKRAVQIERPPLPSVRRLARSCAKNHMSSAAAGFLGQPALPRALPRGCVHALVPS